MTKEEIQDDVRYNLAIHFDAQVEDSEYEYSCITGIFNHIYYEILERYIAETIENNPEAENLLVNNFDTFLKQFYEKMDKLFLGKYTEKIKRINKIETEIIEDLYNKGWK